ncbi:MAG: toxin [Candidatus Omnitrophica bacterium]|nr:toxin [Candidatus Omnitrophota bacterium]
MRKKELDNGIKRIYNCIYEYSGEIVTGELKWSTLKNIRLKLTRHISFEEIVKADLVGFVKNHAHSNQRVLIYEYKSYIWAVPFVFDRKGIFLKTIYPSRKYKKLYERGASHEK